MWKLLIIEWLKNYSYKPVRIFTIIYFVLLILFIYLSTQAFSFAGLQISLAKQGLLSFPEIWNTTTYISAILKFFLGLIIIFTITYEFSNKMFRQNIIDGMSKKEFLFSKILTISVMTLFSTFIICIAGVLLGYKYSENVTSELIFKEIYFIFGYILKLFTFLSLLLFLSVVLRKAIFVFLTLFLLWIIEFIASIVANQLKFNFIYSPFNAMSELIISPAYRIEGLGREYIFTVPYLAILVCIIYSILFIGGSYYIIKKRDW